jgi:hypothetical protein
VLTRSVPGYIVEAVHDRRSAPVLQAVASVSFIAAAGLGYLFAMFQLSATDN